MSTDVGFSDDEILQELKHVVGELTPYQIYAHGFAQGYASPHCDSWRGFRTWMEARLERKLQDKPVVCTWTEDEDGIWHGTCGTMWEFINDGPVENKVNHCHRCGQPVIPVPYKEVSSENL